MSDSMSPRIPDDDHGGLARPDTKSDVTGEPSARPQRPGTWLSAVLTAVVVVAACAGCAVVRNRQHGEPAQAVPPATKAALRATAAPGLTRTVTPATAAHPVRRRAHRPTSASPAVSRSVAASGSPPARPASSPSVSPRPTPSRSSATPDHIEEAYNKHGVPTFTDYANASGPGSILAFAQDVEIACKVYDPSVASTSPGGYWYRIASPPWDGHFYAVANTFLNGDPPAGPYTHFYDPKVPDC